jgi:hypothetical protein
VIIKSLTATACSLVVATGPVAYASGDPVVKGPRFVSEGNSAIWTKKCGNGTTIASWWETFDWSGYEFLKQQPRRPPSS